MKPFGPVPSAFRRGGETLVIGGRTAEALVEANGSPLFVYDMGMVRAQVARFRRAVPAGVQLHYAVKANPHSPLLRRIAPLVDGFDVASMGEAARAWEAGEGKPVSFAGPGKLDREIEAALRGGITINLESAAELDRAVRIADQLGVRPRLALRVNPPFELRGSGMRMGGGASPFGVDAEHAAALVRRIVAAGADYRGLHVYAGSQTLSAEAVIEAQAATVALAGRIADEAGHPPPLVNLGGGFGVPYFAGDEPLDVETVGAALGDAIAGRPASLADAGFAIELGRWLVAEAGVYLTRVVDRKESRGRTFLVVDGGMHHQLAASGNFGTVVRRNFPVAVASRWGAEAEDEVTIVGCLCTPLDRLAEQVRLPRAEPGDIVAIFMAGAYGLSASPSGFLSHEPAAEIVVGD